MEEKTIIETITNELKDQKDFIKIILEQFEELYKMKSGNETTDFQLGFHIGEIYKHLQQFQSENNSLTSEIINFIESNTKQS